MHEGIVSPVVDSVNLTEASMMRPLAQRALLLIGGVNLVPALLALWLGSMAAWPSAWLAPLRFGFSHASTGDPLPLAVLAIALTTVLLAILWRRWWSLLLYVALGSALVGLGFEPGGGLREAIAYTGRMASIAPGTSAGRPWRGCAL
jgi:hypothetical protein